MADNTDSNTLPNDKPFTAEQWFYHALARDAADYAGKIADYSESIRLNPRSAAAYINRCSAHFHADNLADALQDITEALRLNPQVSLAYSSRGEVHFAMQNFASAQADFQLSLRLRPSYEYAKAGLAITLHASGDRDRAFELWMELLAQDETYRDADATGEKLTWVSPLIEEARMLIAGMGKDDS